MDDRKSHFSPFQINTQLFFTNGSFRMTDNNFRSHFSTFQINTEVVFFCFFFTKWLPAAILDDRKSLSIAFLAISDQYATLFTKWLPAAILDDRKSFLIAFLAISVQYATFILFTKWLPTAILNDRNHFRSHFSPFQINTQLFWGGGFFFKMAAGGHFGNPIWAILDDRKSLSIAFLAISDQYTTFFC